MSHMNIGVEAQNELQTAFVLRDVRPLSQKIGDWLKKPTNYRNTMAGLVILYLIFPVLLLPGMVISLGFSLYWKMLKNRHIRLPFRLPMWTKVPDPSTLEDKAKSPWPAPGIAFLGNQRQTPFTRGGEELWLSDSDLRTHRIVMGTTGAGKTNTLLSWLLNSMCWGSGYTYSDGKAQNDVFIKVFGMAALFWREDDVLCVNYMMGGDDPFIEIAKNIKKLKKRKSNTLNPFGTAGNEAINQMLSSMMGKASGDGAMWQGKAINMLSGVTQVSTYLRAKGEKRVSVKTLRDHMSLPSLIEFDKRNSKNGGDLPEMAVQGISAYLSVGLPGFNKDAAKAGKPQPQTALDQHGYLTGQFTRTLGMLGDSYGHIFNDTLPEVDMVDVVLNNRILFVMIPTLEKSTEEAANLGKIVVMACKMMMAANLGAEVEGDTDDLVDNRPTTYPRPYDIYLDELGYYFASGIDLMFAQGRSLGIALTASGQDFQAMSKGENKNEVESMIANTRLKVALKCEDPKETFEVFQRAAGEAFVAQVGGFEKGGSSNLFDSSSNATVTKVNRITLQELKDVGPGDGIFILGGKVVRASMYDIFQDFKLPSFNLQINSLLPINSPTIGEIVGKCKASSLDKTAAIMSLIQSGNPPFYNQIHTANPMICSMLAALEKIPEALPATTRGIVLFMAAKKALEQRGAQPSYDFVDIPDGSSGPELQEFNREPSGLVQAGIAMVSPADPLAVDPLAFLNEPPFEAVRQVVTPLDMKKPSDNDDWGGAAVDEAEYGVVPSEERRIDFTEEAKEDLASIIKSSAAGKISQVKVEIEKMRTVVDRATEFRSADKGRDNPPVAMDSHDEIDSFFADISKKIEEGSRNS